MPHTRELRETLGLTQSHAAKRAGVSLATWRRWETAPLSVSVATRAKCEKVLDRESAIRNRHAELDSNFELAWANSSILTPRQAYALAAVLDGWADTELTMWLDDNINQPLHEISPFSRMDRRALFHVDGNKAWAAKALERCRAVAQEIENGILPFDRPGCYFDELLMAAALFDAPSLMQDMPELFENLTPQSASDTAPEDEDFDYCMDDEDWDTVGERFDSQSRWGYWDTPFYNDSAILTAILAKYPPYTWFDPAYEKPSQEHTNDETEPS
ncbi:hypothetical protein Rruber_05485 (plasmid) [Rhodococcus ruber]